MDVGLKISALKRLMNLTASGIGAIAGPMLARWTARANADALRIEAEGKADSIKLIASAQQEASGHLTDSTMTTEVDIGEEIEARISFQEEKRQRNIESVVRSAADQLGDKEVQDQDIDHDWTAAFFSSVQDVSSEQMRQVWGRILAGEAENAGQISIQTLSILK